MKPQIIGFMPSYNLHSQGYPFLEAIYSALHVVDKLYITDGSTDDTPKIFDKLHNRKIRIYHKDWELTKKNTKRGGILRDVSNDLLDKIKKEYANKDNTYIFSIQANEVIHEDDYRFIRDIPNIYPNYKGYWLYYYEFFNTYFFGEQYRLRLAPLSNNVVVDGDSWTLRILGGFRQQLKMFLGSQLLGLSRHGQFNDGFFYSYFKYRFVYAPKPIFRYSGIFRDDMVRKLEQHKKLFQQISFDYSDKTKSDKEFWKYLIEHTWKTGHRAEFPNKAVNINEHPKIMRPLLRSPHYYMRANLIKEINKL